MTLRVRILFLVLVLAVAGSANAASVLRIACEGNDRGASVFVNGAFKGDCPVDVQVAEGEVEVRVVREVDANREQVFQQKFRIGEGVAKRVDVALSAPQLNAAAQQRETERREAARLAKEKADAETQRVHAERLAASLDEFQAQGAEINNGVPGWDCEQCPPVVLVQVPGSAPIGFGKYEVTRAQFAAFVAETGYKPTSACIVWVGGWLTNLYEMWQVDARANWTRPGFAQGDDHPVVCISWEDATAYTRWLSQKTGKKYRLPTTAEWRDAAMNARVQLAVPWTPQSASLACQFGNVFDAAGEGAVSHGLGEAYPCNDGAGHTAPVGKYAANAFGIYDLWGNVEELTAEKFKFTELFGIAGPNYDKLYGVPTRGGSWAGARNGALAAGVIDLGKGKNSVGMRVVRVLD